MILDSQKDADDTISTRIISQRSLTVDGVEFQWWAVGEHPSLVTVRAQAFGSHAEFTYADVEWFALKLAQKVMMQHYERARLYADREAHRTRDNVPPLARPGWFEEAPDPTQTLF